TTHYMEEAEKLSDRVAIIVKGRIAAEGEVKSLIARHGGKTKLLFEELDSRAAEMLRERGFEVEQRPSGRVVVRVGSDSEMFEVLTALRSMGYHVYPEIKQAGLEDVFLSVIGSKLSNTGELT
ncbi:MAG: ABC transporter ATP-binding protein, partial [Candidatus Caldarchaeum sp.]|nr:ABC transporter ATP-binding protein [Candidatus Caldarchaeum sp.]